MILVGRYESPFVRRVGVALTLLELPFERQPLSVFRDIEALGRVNPLRRVPALIIENDEVLFESGAILDWVDEWVGPERALMPRRGAARRHALRICAMATGLGDKTLSLFVERGTHTEPSESWVRRCGRQIDGALDALEAERAKLAEPFWHGGTPGHADVAVACMLGFNRLTEPERFDPKRYPALAAHAERCEALPPFQACREPMALAAG